MATVKGAAVDRVRVPSLVSALPVQQSAVLSSSCRRSRLPAEQRRPPDYRDVSSPGERERWRPPPAGPWRLWASEMPLEANPPPKVAVICDENAAFSLKTNKQKTPRRLAVHHPDCKHPFTRMWKHFTSGALLVRKHFRHRQNNIYVSTFWYITLVFYKNKIKLTKIAFSISIHTIYIICKFFFTIWNQIYSINIHNTSKRK